jgi:acyl carrier protein
MITIDQAVVEDEIIKIVEDLNTNLKIGATVNKHCAPGRSGFASQILVDMMADLEDALGVTIPSNQYIFFDKTNHRQLTIKEAAQKLIKVATYG